MKTGEQLLKEFCADYLAWVRGGAQAGHGVFRRDSGLCWLTWTWAEGLEDYLQLDDAMREAFKAARLDRVLPFNASEKPSTLKLQPANATSTQQGLHSSKGTQNDAR
jgi:hypothetical protein